MRRRRHAGFSRLSLPWQWWIFHYTCHARDLLRPLCWGTLCATGVCYATALLLANQIGAQARAQPEPEVALALWQRAAALAPFHVRFRIMPAVYSIYGQAHGQINKDDALAEVDNALTFNPHHGYLAAHRASLRGMRP